MWVSVQFCIGGTKDIEQIFVLAWCGNQQGYAAMLEER
jgi:hypothetical protein